MTIERKTVYVDNDGTEHSSLQSAACVTLENALYGMIEQCLPNINTHELVTLTTGLASRSKALRKALDSYFEAVAEQPVVEENVKYKPFTAQESNKGKLEHLPFEDFELPEKAHSYTTSRTTVEDWIHQGWTSDGLHTVRGRSGLELTEKARAYGTNRTTIDDWVQQGWTIDGMQRAGFLAPGVHGFVIPTVRSLGVSEVRGFETPGVRSFKMTVPEVRGFEMTVPAGSMMPKSGTDVPKEGNTDDPTTWRVEDLPVDHPSYCRPFGTRGA